MNFLICLCSFPQTCENHSLLWWSDVVRSGAPIKVTLYKFTITTVQLYLFATMQTTPKGQKSLSMLRLFLTTTRLYSYMHTTSHWRRLGAEFGGTDNISRMMTFLEK